MDFDAALPETRITITQRLKEIGQSSRKVKSDVDYWWRLTVKVGQIHRRLDSFR